MIHHFYFSKDDLMKVTQQLQGVVCGKEIDQEGEFLMV